MAAPLTPCDSCGSPILDSDLETGAAVTLLGKRYCPGCKSEAIQSVSLDDLAKRSAPSKSPPKPPSPKAAAPSPSTPPTMKAAPAKAATPPSPARPAPAKAAPGSDSRKPLPRRPVTAPPPSNKPLILASAAVAVVLAAVGAYYIFKAAPVEDGGTSPKGPTASPVKGPPADPAAAARDAFAKVEQLAGNPGVSWDHLLAAADKARPLCKGTEWEKKLEEIHSHAKQEKEAEEASREITPLLDELKGAVATDPEFKRFPELQKKFEALLEMAGKSRSVKMTEIRALQREYNGKYEKLAEPHYTEINEAAVQLADERRFDDALRKINTFPQHLRHSGAWLSLEKLKQDIERRKKK